MQRVDVDQVRFSSREFLKMVEDVGLSGSWGWDFETDQHFWSPGLYRLFGMTPHELKPSFDTFLGFLHPEDRKAIESASEILRHGVIADKVFRLMRPDGSVRIVRGKSEVFVRANGTPFKASGVLVDITDQERLAELRIKESRRAEALFRSSQSFSFYYNNVCSDSEIPAVPRELLDLTGLSLVDFTKDRLAMVVEGERERWRKFFCSCMKSGATFRAAPLIRLRDGSNERFSFFCVPIDIDGRVTTEWSITASPASAGTASDITGSSRAELEKAVRAMHVRCARALLNLSAADLATSSGVSVSTMRRLEEEDGAVSFRSKSAVVAALEAAGITFELRANGTVSVSR